MAPQGSTTSNYPAMMAAPLYRLREPMGELEMTFGVRGDRTVATQQFHRGAMRVIRPHYLDDSGQVYYTMVNPGGGYLGGDEYHLKFHLGQGASVLLTDQSAVKVYRTPGDFVLQETRVVLEDDAVLEYVPDAVILYRESRFRSYFTVEMAPSASFLSAEVVTPGWSPDGGHFLYDEMHLRTAVSINGEPVVIDNLLLEPGSPEFPVEEPLLLEGQTHVGTLIAVDRHIDAGLVEELRALMEDHVATHASTTVLHGISYVPGPGLVVRALGTFTEDIQHLLWRVTGELRGRFRGQGPIHLRKH